MNNTLLQTASTVGKIILYLLYLLIALIVVGISYILLTGGADLLSFITFTDSGIKFYSDGSERNATAEAYPQGLLLFYAIKGCLIILCQILIIREGLRVVDSIKSLATFRLDNIHSFRKIGNLFVLLFVLNIPQLSYQYDSWEFALQFEPSYLLGTLTGYLLAEIFREGNKLMEENKLTI